MNQLWHIRGVPRSQGCFNLWVVNGFAVVDCSTRRALAAVQRCSGVETAVLIDPITPSICQVVPRKAAESRRGKQVKRFQLALYCVRVIIGEPFPVRYSFLEKVGIRFKPLLVSSTTETWVTKTTMLDRKFLEDKLLNAVGMGDSRSHCQNFDARITLPMFPKSFFHILRVPNLVKTRIPRHSQYVYMSVFVVPGSECSGQRCEDACI